MKINITQSEFDSLIKGTRVKSIQAIPNPFGDMTNNIWIALDSGITIVISNGVMQKINGGVELKTEISIDKEDVDGNLLRLE